MKDNDISQEDDSLFGQLISTFGLDDVVENVIDSLKLSMQHCKKSWQSEY